MNQLELTRALFETKFIKALYKTGFDKSLINQIIAEELLRESEESTDDIDSMIGSLESDIDTIKKEEEDPIANIIEIFILAAKVKVVYVPKFEKIQAVNPDFLDDTRIEKLNKYAEIVKNIANSLGRTDFQFEAFVDAFKEGELNKEEVRRALEEKNPEKLKQIYEKLQSTAVKAFNDVIRDIDKEEKTQDIKSRSGALTTLRKILQSAKNTISQLDRFVERSKQKLGDDFNKYGKLNAFINDDVKSLKEKITNFIESIKTNREKIEQELEDLRALREETEQTPEFIQEIVNSWKDIKKEIVSVFDQLGNRDLYEKGDVDELGKSALPKVTLEDGSLAEMLAHALAYEEDDSKSKKSAQSIYDILKGEKGVFKGLSQTLKKTFNEEEEKTGPSKEERNNYDLYLQSFEEYEAEIALAFAVKHVENFPSGLEDLDDEEDVKLNFDKKELNNDRTSINILKIFIKNDRKLSGIQYEIEKKLRKGGWDASVYKKLLSLDSSIFDASKFDKSLISFLNKIYLKDYDAEAVTKEALLRRKVIKKLRKIFPNIPQSDLTSEKSWYRFVTLKNYEFLKIIHEFIKDIKDTSRVIPDPEGSDFPKQMSRATPTDSDLDLPVNPDADPLDENAEAAEITIDNGPFLDFLNDEQAIEELRLFDFKFNLKFSKYLLGELHIDEDVKNKIFGDPGSELEDVEGFNSLPTDDKLEKVTMDDDEYFDLKRYGLSKRGKEAEMRDKLDVLNMKSAKQFSDGDDGRIDREKEKIKKQKKSLEKQLRRAKKKKREKTNAKAYYDTQKINRSKEEFLDSERKEKKNKRRAAQFKKSKQRKKQLDKTNRVATRGGRTFGPGDESMYLEESIEKLIYLMIKEYKLQKEP